MQTMVDLQTISELYKIMLKIRLTEEKVAEIYPSDKIQSPIHLSIGQEAVAAGVCMALGPENKIFSTYRSHGIFVAKGGDLRLMFAELYGKETGCAGGKGGSMHLLAPEVGFLGSSAIVASTIPLATGNALASDYQDRKWVSTAFFGDGALGEGVFYESLNFAILKNLPVLYICENNGLAVHSRVEDRHHNSDLYRYGERLGVTGSRHDGDDVLTVYTVTKNAIKDILLGGPPILLEFTTCRWSEHVGPGTDHDEMYRDQDKVSQALANDPINRIQKVLQTQFEITDGQLSTWRNNIVDEINQAVIFAEESSFPSPEDLYQGVFMKQDI
ncbi:MAG: thiamine pyrophosphate-dependent dehydrogenase E1 component subunit alpha [Acidobacteriota bacterium]|nr:thiamine pyrophosphate-dependent dehydrogenase E1 component subunit alpha [Acidobacteriota bacterium]